MWVTPTLVLEQGGWCNGWRLMAGFTFVALIWDVQWELAQIHEHLRCNPKLCAFKSLELFGRPGCIICNFDVVDFTGKGDNRGTVQ